MRVTEVDGTRLVSLNGMPAIDAFEEHAEATGQKLDKSEPLPFFLHNILGIDSEGGHRLRVPLAVNDDGSVSCAAEVPAETIVHIMKSSASSSIEAASAAASAALRGLGDHSPSVALFFDCVATRLRMGEAFGLELEGLGRLLTPASFVGSTAMVRSRQLAHLTRLVDDLLDVSRITRGRIELRRAPVSLGDVIARAIESTRPTLDARRHELSVMMPEAAIVVDADAVRLVQVFGNLLNNAAKYTDPGGHIRLEIAHEDDVVVTRVIDDGVGLSPEMLPRVFDLFVQAERSLDRAQSGLGIGLRLVQALVELHGGHVAAYSDGVGTGSRFEVRLPVLTNGRVIPAPTQRRTPLLPGRDLRVLVVDDNRDAASSLAELITAMGFSTNVVHDGLVALQVAADSRPDLVLLDIGLPTIDGYEVARRLRRLRRLSKDCCLVALTGYGSEADREPAHNAGFNAYVVKPIDVDRLTELWHLAASCVADVAP